MTDRHHDKHCCGPHWVVIYLVKIKNIFMWPNALKNVQDNLTHLCYPCIKPEGSIYVCQCVCHVYLHRQTFCLFFSFVFFFLQFQFQKQSLLAASLLHLWQQYFNLSMLLRLSMKHFVNWTEQVYLAIYSKWQGTFGPSDLLSPGECVWLWNELVWQRWRSALDAIENELHVGDLSA